MAKTDRHRWWDWRINLNSGESIRADDKREPKMDDKRRAGKGWWWTLAWRKMSCHTCGRWISLDDKVAYNHHRRQIFCPRCAEAAGVAEHCELSKKLRRVGR